MGYPMWPQNEQSSSLSTDVKPSCSLWLNDVSRLADVNEVFCCSRKILMAEQEMDCSSDGMKYAHFYVMWNEK